MQFTYNCADLVVHLCQFVLHLPAVDAMCVAGMIHPQVVGDQHIPAGRPLQQGQQVLRVCNKQPSSSSQEESAATLCRCRLRSC